MGHSRRTPDTFDPKACIIATSASSPEHDDGHEFRERQTFGQGRTRLISLAIALAIEALIILLLLTLGWGISNGDEETADIVTFEARDIGDEPETEEEEEPAPEQPAPTPQEPQPVTEPTPVLPTPQPLPPSPLNLPTPTATPTPAPPTPTPSPAPTQAPPAEPASPPRVYGPPDTGGSQSKGSDSRRVGTAPNGEPLYAARWYREPTDGELSGYLSTANGPGSALIACKTVPDFYVEDCQLLGESPAGSQIGRAVLAAAWQFRVRPARIGGRSQVGSWVRIRIDYTQAPVRR